MCLAASGAPEMSEMGGGLRFRDVAVPQRAGAGHTLLLNSKTMQTFAFYPISARAHAISLLNS